MIKKILFSIGIIGLGIINFSNAYTHFNIPLNTEVEITDGNQNANLTYLSNINFKTDNDYNLISIISTPSNNSSIKRLWNVFWTNNGLYFMSTCGGTSYNDCNNINTKFTLQGYASQYCIYTGSNIINDYGNKGVSFVPCSDNAYTNDISGRAGLNEFSNSSELDLFIDNQSITLCFKYPNEYICILSNVGYKTPFINSLGFTFNPKIDEVSSSNILNYITYSPWGSPSNGGSNTLSKPNYICPTFGQLLEQQNFNTGLCYNTTLRIENGQLTTIPQKNILETFTDYEEFTNYRSIYKNKCDTIQGITEECENAFTGEIEKYIIIANAEETEINKKILWNNCNIALNYDLNTTTCVASGYIAEQPTTEDLIKRITNGNYTTINDIYVPGTGNILNRLLEDGETREEKANRDILGNFTQLVGKITSIFNARSGVQGVIPEYIIWLIFVSLFLTVILKK